ncbi:MAG: TRAP transporter small permease [Alphaproteobacteria bacterium]
MSHETDGAASGPERVVGAVAAVAAGVAALLVIVMLAITSYGVFMRYVLGAPVTWTEELSGYLVVALVMLGAADALLRGEHISVDLLTDRARGLWRHVAGVWGMVCVLALAGAMTYSAVLMLQFSIDFGMYSDGYMEAPLWAPQAFVLLGGVFLAVAALARIYTLLRR